MKKRIISFLLVLVLVCSLLPMTAYAASTATIIRAVDNNPSVGKGTYNLTFTLKTSTAANSNIAKSSCENSRVLMYFPYGTTYSSVSTSGASSTSAETDYKNTHWVYKANLTKSLMTTNGNTMTISIKGIDSMPYQIVLFLYETTISRTYKGDITLTQDGNTYVSTTLGGSTGSSHIDLVFGVLVYGINSKYLDTCRGQTEVFAVYKFCGCGFQHSS